MTKPLSSTQRQGSEGLTRRHGAMAAEQYWEDALRVRLIPFDDLASKSSLSDTLQSFDDEESSMRRAMQSLRTRRNALIPISRLPPEILTRIFTINAAADIPGIRDKTKTRPRLGWITVTHVCRRWREMVLDLPILWAQLALPLGDKWAEEMVARAKSVPLVFDCLVDGGMYRLTTQARNLIVKLAPRAKQLSLNTDDPHAAVLFPALKTSAPLLDKLEIGYTCRYRIVESGSQIMPLPAFSGPFPDDFLGKHTPLLRYVRFYGSVLVPWTSSILNNLVSLSLHLEEDFDYPDDEGRDSAPSMDEVLDALDRMTSLESLILTNGLPHPTNSSTPNRIVKLPNLKTASIQSTVARCATFLPHLELGTDVTISVDVIGPGPPDSGRDTFFQLIGTFANIVRGPRKCGPRISGLSIDSEWTPDSASLLIAAWRNSDGDRDYSEPADISVSLTWWLDPDGPTNIFHRWSSIDLARAVCNIFPFQELRDLRLAVDNHERDVQAWRDVVARASGLQQVTIVGDSIGQAFCLALKTGPTGTPSFLPALSTLSLHDVNFRRSTGMNGDSGSKRILPLHSALPVYLTDRARKGAPLKKLFIDGDAEPSGRWVVELREALRGVTEVGEHEG
ncbi:hypothetical protein BV25DRAFT_1832555 [Artomyces pyxidatus]|uniref:Uncharacterized protein n=1 Tax=Artomyces pyxidatus TaxID=48021 RepID=A0ACB8SI24_9AGAM|nr:hypothetical protein BV25DRAFT_1832555 [Artomyces pyxidatus]